MNCFEELERRRLLAGITIFALPGRLIRIAGTSGNDHVTVALYGHDQVQITDGVISVKYQRSEVKKITFFGGNGNDFITLGNVMARAYLDGGSGNDSLSASAGDRDDTLRGDDGNDYLYGGPGADDIDGGTGGDLEIGNLGDDFLQCMPGVNAGDTISGGQGFDVVNLSTSTTDTFTTIGRRSGTPQQNIINAVSGDIESFIGSGKNDTVVDYSNRPIIYDMGDGNDVVHAGQGNDTITGGPGQDSIDAGGGNDQIYAYDGEVDSIVGGDGRDSCECEVPFIDANPDIIKSVEILSEPPPDVPPFN